jgi:hypothetical protein
VGFADIVPVWAEPEEAVHESESKTMNGPLISPKLRHIGALDIAGGGQIVVSENHAYIGHMKPPHGTTIIDVSDPANPVIVAEIPVGNPYSHTHKVRVAGNRMITNVEQNRRHFLRKGENIEKIAGKLEKGLGRLPEEEEVAAAMNISLEELGELRAGLERGYEEGGFKLWDISNPAAPVLLHFEKTSGFGVHRFDMDERYAYISTEMEGYIGNILVIYDITLPLNVHEVSRWWMPGQNLAGGEIPTWSGYGNRLHHALRIGDELWASVWHAGIRVIDISDITRPSTVGSYNYHPPVLEPTHTVVAANEKIAGRRIALACDEEHEHIHGQPHAGLWILDISDLNAITPLSSFHVSEMDSPWARAPGRFGMHQFQEHFDSDKVFCAWFSGGLRVVDIADPCKPFEDAFFIPQPRAGLPSPQSNDVDTDDRGLAYLLDRNCGLDILEYKA